MLPRLESIDRSAQSDGQIEVRRFAEIRAQELLWRDSDDLEGLTVQANRAAYDFWIGSENVLPGLMGQDGDRCRRTHLVIGWLQKSAPGRCQAQNVEVVARDQPAGQQGRGRPSSATLREVHDVAASPDNDDTEA